MFINNILNNYIKSRTTKFKLGNSAMIKELKKKDNVLTLNYCGKPVQLKGRILVLIDNNRRYQRSDLTK